MHIPSSRKAPIKLVWYKFQKPNCKYPFAKLKPRGKNFTEILRPRTPCNNSWVNYLNTWRRKNQRKVSPEQQTWNVQHDALLHACQFSLKLLLASVTTECVVLSRHEDALACCRPSFYLFKLERRITLKTAHPVIRGRGWSASVSLGKVDKIESRGYSLHFLQMNYRDGFVSRYCYFGYIFD